MEWYYEINDTQNGPVDEAALKRLVENGTLSSENLVWKAGMDDWVPIANVMPNLFSVVRKPVAGSTIGSGSLSGGLRGGGAGASFRRENPLAPAEAEFPSCSELRSRARAGLSSCWGTAILAFFIFGVIQTALNIVPLLGWIASSVIIGPLTLGLAALFLSVVRGQKPSVGMIFGGFKQFGTAFGLFALTNVIILVAVFAIMIPTFFIASLFLGGGDPEGPIAEIMMLVFMAPAIFVGVWLYCRFALIYYIANDEPELGVLGSIKMSGELMSGLKLKFVLLSLSFLGWHLLGMLLFGLGLLVSIPYMLAAFAAFYEAASGSTGEA